MCVLYGVCIYACKHTCLCMDVWRQASETGYLLSLSILLLRWGFSFSCTSLRAFVGLPSGLLLDFTQGFCWLGICSIHLSSPTMFWCTTLRLSTEARAQIQVLLLTEQVISPLCHVSSPVGWFNLFGTEFRENSWICSVKRDTNSSFFFFLFLKSVCKGEISLVL